MSWTWDLDSGMGMMGPWVVEVTLWLSGCVWKTRCTLVMIRAH